MQNRKPLILLVNLIIVVAACQAQAVVETPLPTSIPVAELSVAHATAVAIPETLLMPSTFTPLPETAVSTSAIVGNGLGRNTNATPTETRYLPTRTPVTPTVTPTRTPFGTAAAPPTTPPEVKPINQYSLQEIIPFEAFPVPVDNNGWGMHWMPTVSQETAVVDRFVNELVRMHIKWAVFLNDGTNIGSNDYLVDKLVANGIMPVMRLYRSGVLPYDGRVGDLVAHYRPRGVYYYQLYNEPNVNGENHQGFPNPNQYALTWASAAREVIANGGLPGIAALSPGGQYNHYDFLDRTLNALEYNGDGHLLNHTWLSIHNYHGTRPLDDPEGFLLFRNYDQIVRSHLGRSLPMIGTEAGSYSTDPQVEKNLIIWQYSYMRNAEPYLLAHSYWLLANSEGGGFDTTWDWQSLFKPGFVHPAITEFFYQNSR
ncbi:MAG: hypothetical protein GY943_09160 [Chloroflexi bacterium]|nr:hypothetical protein [Chloroflexota bacterium]